MSGNSKENLEVAKYYLNGIFQGFLDATVRNKRFFWILLGCTSYNSYKNDAFPLVSLDFWSQNIINAIKLSLASLVAVNYETLYYIIKALPRDVKGIYRFANVLRTIRWADTNNFTVAKYLDQNASKFPDKVCFYYEDEKWTFRQVQEMSNRVGNYFSTLGFKKGDVIALYMPNHPSFVCIWLGINKIGATAALVNYNLRLKSLQHCIEIVNAKAIIYGYELKTAMEELLKLKKLDVPIFCSGHGKDSLPDFSQDFDKEILKAPATTPSEQETMKLSDSLYYIYTSGTTGLPKAAVIKQYRFMMAANGVHFMNNVTKDDIVYDSLPLYHMTGGMVGVGQALLFGSSLVIRKKFSASQFWKDCIKYNVTVAQYLGETCRYLLAQPPSPEDKAHKVRLMSGNGLRHEIWREFVERFNIQEVGEVYGSTEGNCNLSNVDSKEGAVGFVPRFVYSVLPTALIKINEDTGEPLRDPKTGLCIRCKPNEPGEMVGKIVKQHPIRDFQGYTDGQSTSKKIIQNVFMPGDTCFRTGDILMMDNLAYFYFYDRTGDTFRWKGENVSTTEVESVISSCSSYQDAVVYGVKVPNTDGRAGMVAIADPNKNLNLDSLASGITRNLPPYARPLFLRIMDEVDTTGTYKLRKVKLQKEGYNIKEIKDSLYFFKSEKFLPLNEELYNKINSGAIRL